MKRPLRCSFCGKPKDEVGKLIAIWNSIIEDDRQERTGYTPLDAIKEAIRELP